MQLFERTRHDRNRPLLQVPDPLGRLKELLAERGPVRRAGGHRDRWESRQRHFCNTADHVKWTSDAVIEGGTRQSQLSDPCRPRLAGQSGADRPASAATKGAGGDQHDSCARYILLVSCKRFRAGIACLSCELPDGEQYKDWVTLNQIFDALLSNRCERGTTLIALGGG